MTAKFAEKNKTPNDTRYMMQKICTSKLSIIYYFLALIFVSGYCATASHGATNTTTTLPKKITTESTSSSEIWSRLRQHFNLSTTASHPLIQRHIKNLSKHQDYIDKIMRNASPYLYYVLGEVEKRGMPSEIALVPMIESTFDPQVISSKGAAGVWQIMPVLGRMHGLKQTAGYDGRKDVYESTKVALDHLQYLHKRFNGNWPLALAAYNAGEARVLRAIKQNKSAKKPTDFWSLKLPTETTHYVPKILAIATIIKSPKTYGVNLSSIPNKAVIKRIDTGKAIDIAHAAKLTGTSETQLRKLNSGLKKSAQQNSTHYLVVPIHSAGNIANAAPKSTAAPKTTAKTTNTKMADVKIASSNAKAKTKVHIVKRGDNLPLISEKYHVKLSKLTSANNLKVSSIIHPGQRIIIPS